MVELSFDAKDFTFNFYNGLLPNSTKKNIFYGHPDLLKIAARTVWNLLIADNEIPKLRARKLKVSWVNHADVQSIIRQTDRLGDDAE